jgi:hypothetical protein
MKTIKKTVRNAVIELKASLEGTYRFRFDHADYIFHDCVDVNNNWIAFELKSDCLNANYEYVCNSAEFIAEVDLLASNMGRATQSYAEYKALYNSVMGARIGGVGYAGYNPESPVFTQEMADKSVLPSVGDKCYITYPTGSHDCEVLGYDGSYVWFKGVGIHRTFRVDKCEFKPLTPPITLEEQALNDMVEQLTNEGIITYDPIMLRILIEKFKGNKIRGVTFQPLAVKDD